MVLSLLLKSKFGIWWDEELEMNKFKPKQFRTAEIAIQMNQCNLPASGYGDIFWPEQLRFASGLSCKNYHRIVFVVIRFRLNV